MKKVKLLFLLTMVCSIFVLTSCKMTYDCAPSNNWVNDETGHWHPCVIPSCDLKFDEEMHEFSEWEIIEEATEEHNGLREHYCTVCGFIEEEELEFVPHAHSNNGWEKDGTKHWHECSDCEEVYDVEEHKLSWSVQTPATCQNGLVEKGECSVCGYTTTRTGELGSHTLSDVAAKDATCTEDGNVAHKHCSVCNKNFDAQGNELTNVVVASPGHSYSSEVTKEPTQTEDGVKTFTCSVCGDSYTEVIPSLGHQHSFEEIAAKDPTCTEDGNVFYKYCEGCDKKFDAEGNELTDVVIPAIGEHTYGAWVDNVEENIQERKCSVCSQVGESRPLTDLWDTTTVSTELLGAGTEEDPYQIHSGADLAYFRANAASISYAKLMRNIDVNSSNFMITSYAGTFDGNGYAIKGLAMTGSGTTVPTALFHDLSSGGVIKNLSVYGTANAQWTTAGLVARNAGSIVNCKNYVNVTSKWDVGGLVALSTGTIDKCENHGTVTGNSNTGGVVGWAKATVSNCKNYGNVTSDSWAAGGIAGKAEATISDCYNEGAVKNLAQGGGIVGNSSAAITNCVNAGEVNSTKEQCGGIAGYSSGSITDCTNKGTIDGAPTITGGIVGTFSGSLMEKCINEATVKGTNTTGGLAGKVWVSGTATIKNCENKGAVVATSWIIGGLFGSLDCAEVSDCVNNGDVTSTSGTIGGIAGAVYANGKLTNCDNYGVIKGADTVGGIVGSCKGVLTNCTNEGEINGANTIGGIAGILPWRDDATTIVTGCENKGAVVATSWNIGGLFGTVDCAEVTDCVNNGTVTSTDGTVGGIVGSVYEAGKLTNCHNNKDVTAVTTVGGIAGTNKGVLTNCDNTGNLVVTSCSGTIDGICPSNNGTITESENSGTVTKNHTEETLPAVDATCGETGLTEGKKCSVCNEILVAQIEIPATGEHSYGEKGVLTSNGTGYDMVYTCTVCNEEKIDNSKMLTEEEYLAQPASFNNVWDNTSNKRTKIYINIKLEKGSIIEFVGDSSVYKFAVVELLTQNKAITGALHDSSWNTTQGENWLGTQTQYITHAYDAAYIAITVAKIDESAILDAELATLHSMFKVYGNKVPELTEEEYNAQAIAFGSPWSTATTRIKISYRVQVAKGAIVTFLGDTSVYCWGVMETSNLDNVGSSQWYDSGWNTSWTDPSVKTYVTSYDRYLILTVGKLDSNGEPTLTLTEDEKNNIRSMFKVEGYSYASGVHTHTEEIIPGKAATCSETGLTEGKKCSTCGEILVAQVEIPATGEHTYGDNYYLVEDDKLYLAHACACGYIEKIEEVDTTNPVEVSNAADFSVVLEAGASVVLTKDVTVDDIITISEGAKVVVDLNGNILNTGFVEGSTTNHAYAFENHGELVITGNGVINARGIYNYGELTLENGTINAIDGNGGYGVRCYDGAIFTMNGGTIATTLEDDNLVDQGGYDATPLKVDAGATFVMNNGIISNICDFTTGILNNGNTTINGGTITTIHSTISNYGTLTINGGTFVCDGLDNITAHALYVCDGSTTEINSGTFDGKDNYNGFNVYAENGAVVNINGGNFLAVHSGSLYGKGTINVMGGTFFDNPSARVIDGYEVLEENGVYTVVEQAHVHTPSSEWASDSDYHWHTCSGCSELLDKAEHEYTWTTQSAATCTDAEVELGTCICGATTTREGDPANGHSYGAWVDKEDTQERECAVCHETESRPLTDLWDTTSVSTELLGAGTEEDPYQIHSGADLAYFRENAASISHAKLMRNIDVNSSNFMITSYAGTFDGNGYAIKGLAMTGSGTTVPTALFHDLSSGGVIKNLSVYGTANAAWSTAGLVARNAGSIVNCKNYVNVTSKWDVGGLVAVSTGTIDKCENHGTVTGNSNTGGVVGWAKATVSNCKNYGNVTSDSWAAGGIAGKAEATISDCYNEGAVENLAQGGGIVGNSSAAITNCVNAGEVSSTKEQCGGIAGYSSGSITDCTNKGTIKGAPTITGGIVGTFSGSLMEKCINEATVNGTNTTGGLAGKVWVSGTATIKNCENKGAVVATSWIIGGLFGSVDCAEVTDCVNNGTVTSTDGTVGGIAGAVYEAGKLTNCHNNKDVTAVTTVGGIAGTNKGVLTNCDNTGNVIVTNCTGTIDGICPSNSGTITESENSGTVTKNHNLTQHEAKAATCTEDGNVAYGSCSVCNKNYDADGNELTNVVIPGGHKLEDVAAKEATCTEAGWDAYQECSLCGYSTKVEIPATGHSYEKTNKDETTVVYTCGTCGDSYEATRMYTVTVNHLNLDGTNAADAETFEYEYETIYTVNAKKLDNLVASHDYVKGHILSDEGNVINIYYSEVDVWDGTSVSSSLSGSGTVDDPYLIQSGADLAYVAKVVNDAAASTANFKGQYFKMTKSIDLNDNELKIGSYSATKVFHGFFDGNNCTVRGINATQSLFGMLTDGYIKNLSTYGTVTATEKKGVAGLVSYMSGATVENITNYVNVTGVQQVAGVVGWLENNTTTFAKNCVNYGNINATSYQIGGIAGFAKGSISGCTNFGDVTSTGSGYVGGIGGAAKDAKGSRSDCVNYGNISGTSYVGGCFGQITATTTTTNCYSYGTAKIISGTATTVGEVVGSGASYLKYTE